MQALLSVALTFPILLDFVYPSMILLIINLFVIVLKIEIAGLNGSQAYSTVAGVKSMKTSSLHAVVMVVFKSGIAMEIT